MFDFVSVSGTEDSLWADVHNTHTTTADQIFLFMLSQLSLW